MNKHWKLTIVTAIIFIACFRFGLGLAGHKALWTDEIFGQFAVAERHSYADLILARTREGNASPLYYVIQKTITKAADFKSPDFWYKDGTLNRSEDPYAMLIMRIASDLFMAAACASIFYYFTRFHSLSMGVYALLLFLSNYIVWIYWAEARVYSLWILLTSWHMLLMLYISQKEKIESLQKKILAALHVALALTIPISGGQIAGACVLLWLFKIERNPKYYLYLAGLPFAIIFFYLTKGMKVGWHVANSWDQLILTCAPWPILMFCLLFAIVFALNKGLKRGSNNFKGGFILSFIGMMLLMAIGLFAYFKVNSLGPNEANKLTIRYFVFLTPVSVIASVYMFHQMIRYFCGRIWVMANLIILALGILIISFLTNGVHILRYGFI